MKIFFLCRTGHHTALLAASLYLNVIDKPANSKFLTDFKKLLDIPGFNKNSRTTIGRPFFVGTDDKNTEVYTIGVSYEGKLLQRAAGDLLRLMNIDRDQWHMFDTSPYISKWTLVGLILDKLYLGFLARLFFYKGAKKELGVLDKIVNDCRQKILNPS